MLSTAQVIRELIRLGVTPARAPQRDEAPKAFLESALLQPFLQRHLPSGPSAPAVTLAVRSHENQLIAYCCPSTFEVYDPDLALLLAQVPGRERPYLLSVLERTREAVAHVAPMFTPRRVSEVFSQCGDWSEWCAFAKVEYRLDPSAPDAEEQAAREEVSELLHLMRALRAFTDHDHHPLAISEQRLRSPLSRRVVRACAAVRRAARAVPCPDPAAMTAAFSLLDDWGGEGGRVAWRLGFSHGLGDVTLEALSEEGRYSLEVGEFPAVWAARLLEPVELAAFVAFVRAYRAVDEALVTLSQLVLALEGGGADATTHAA